MRFLSFGALDVFAVVPDEQHAGCCWEKHVMLQTMCMPQ